MRLTSLFLALLLVGGLYYWFAVRGPAEQVAAVTSAGDAITKSETAGNAPVPVMVLDSQAQHIVDQLLLRGRTDAIRNVSVPAETA